MKWLNDYRTKLMLVGFVAAIVIGSRSTKADFTWTRKADMPTPRWNFATSVINGKIYAFAGQASESTGIGILYTVEEYDPALDVWTRKADRSGMMTCTDASAVDGKIYVIDGIDSHMEMYDPATDTWTSKADIPTTRRFFATSAVNGKIYAIGGTPPDAYSGLATVEEYDPSTDTWTRKADMPAARWALRASVVNEKIYVFGGRLDLTSEANVYEYNPATDIWTQKADMPIATSAMGSVVLNDKIFVIGGWYWSADFPYTTVQIYDPEIDIWTREADTPFRRAAFSAEVVNNRIYVIGGTDRPHPCPAFPTVYEFGPLFDFNSDGIVDADDMCIMVDHWGTDNSLCDIGPMPWGDGIVDVQDLKVLAEHLFEEVSDPTLIAHWPLDETQGAIAYDNAADCDGTLMGNPVWQPDGGMVGGAILLDGINDYISTDFVLNPVDGDFSVFAWIKGGAAGQVILSQQGGVNWLMADSIDGALQTDLKEPATAGRDPKPSGPRLISPTLVTDDWHRVGFVRDGINRILYVDDVEVARDTATNLEAAGGGLCIGSGSGLEPDTFWAGLIDDVRIYNRAVNP